MKFSTETGHTKNTPPKERAFFTVILFQCVSVAECLTYLFANNIIAVIYRLVCYRFELCEINAALVVKNAFVSSNVYYPAKNVALFCESNKLTFQNNRKFVDNRCVNKAALFCCKTRLCHFVSSAVCRYYTNIIASLQVSSVSKAYRESLFLLDVLCGLVALAKAKLHHVSTVKTANAIDLEKISVPLF